MSELSFVIIPALNEEKSIANVLEAALSANPEVIDVERIIVVDNGSSDSTYTEARKLTPYVVECPRPGKGYAMDAGVSYAKEFGARVITFLDADLIGLNGGHIESLAIPVLNDEASMVIGRMSGRSVLGRSALFSVVSGQRSLTTEVWGSLQYLDLKSWRTEAALYALFRNANRISEIKVVGLDGVSHRSKFAKQNSVFRASVGFMATGISVTRGFLSRSSLQTNRAQE
jgi:glycosyltransferase involved in cell wall biosynthesis